MRIAVAGSSGLGQAVGISSDPSALLTALGGQGSAHVLVLTPRYLQRRAREQAHVLVSAERERPVGVLALDHHALTLTLIAAAVLELETDPELGWTDAGDAVQLVRQAAARSRSAVWHPRALGLRQPAPSLAQSAASLVRPHGYVAEIGQGAALVRGSGAFAADGEERLFVAGDVPPLLARQLGEVSYESVAVETDRSAPYRTRRSVELCGLAGPAWAALPQRRCLVCEASRPADGCLFCGTGESKAPVAAASV